MKWAVPVAVIIGALAGGLRFAKLGDWSFSQDELATYQEMDSLMAGELSDDPQINKLPRLIPLPYAIHSVAVQQYGRTEWSARMPEAIAGTLLVVIVVLFGWRSLGGWTAAALGLIIAFNAEHLFQSQYHRVYAWAALFAGACAIFAYDALSKQALATMIAAAVCVVLGMLSHTLVAGCFAILLVATLVQPEFQARKPFLIVITSVGLISAVGFAAVLYPQLKGGWNATENWGYSPLRAIQSGITQLGWPTACLAGLGLVLAAFNRWHGSIYWGLWMIAWVASVIMLPKLIKYHPAYSLPFAIGPFVFAAYFMGQMAELLAPSKAWVACLWLLAAATLNLPSIASHYVDGSRHDYREAAAYIAKKRPKYLPVYAISSGFLRHYQPKDLGDAEHILNGEVLKRLQEIRNKNNSAWIVLARNRNGYDADVQAWLNENVQHETTIRHPRYDYYEYAIDVFRMIPK